MPGTNGRELAEKIRHEVPGVRVLFMSGYADEAVSRNGSLDAEERFVELPTRAAVGHADPHVVPHRVDSCNRRRRVRCVRRGCDSAP